MCDPGEKISSTMRREFMEEALNSNQMNEEELDHYKKKIEDVFKNGVEVTFQAAVIGHKLFVFKLMLFEKKLTHSHKIDLSRLCGRSKKH